MLFREWPFDRPLHLTKILIVLLFENQNADTFVESTMLPFIVPENIHQVLFIVQNNNCALRVTQI